MWLWLLLPRDFIPRWMQFVIIEYLNAEALRTSEWTFKVSSAIQNEYPSPFKRRSWTTICEGVRTFAIYGKQHNYLTLLRFKIILLLSTSQNLESTLCMSELNFLFFVKKIRIHLISCLPFPNSFLIIIDYKKILQNCQYSLNSNLLHDGTGTNVSQTRNDLKIKIHDDLMELAFIIKLITSHTNLP